MSLEEFNLDNNIILHAIIHFHVKERNISQKNQREKKTILNPLDEAKDCCRAYFVKPLGHVLDLPYWTYAGSLSSSPLTNFIGLQSFFYVTNQISR